MANKGERQEVLCWAESSLSRPRPFHFCCRLIAPLKAPGKAAAELGRKEAAVWRQRKTPRRGSRLKPDVLPHPSLGLFSAAARDVHCLEVTASPGLPARLQDAMLSE